jgi:AcrR family transcriptional regulator
MPRLITQTVVADFRSRLCDVAADLFNEMGRDGFNMRELAKRLHVSPMTAYRYFRDKEEILAALRARAFARFAARLEATHAEPPAKRSLALAEAYDAFIRQEPSNYRLMFDLFQPHIHAVPELAVEERRARAAMTEHARLMVRDGVFDGEPDLIGQVLWSALHGAAALHLANKLPATELDRILPQTVSAIARAYRGDAMPDDGLPVIQARAASGYSGLAAIPAAE